MYFDPKEFGKRMKGARNRKGLTQERLAEMLGVDRLHVNRLEKGAKACSIDLLIDISQLLDVSPERYTRHLFGRQGEDALGAYRADGNRQRTVSFQPETGQCALRDHVNVRHGINFKRPFPS